MDPYVQVKVTKPWEKVADSAVQNTTCKYDTENPVWEERLSFLLDTREGPGQLHLTIWDSNYVMDSKLTSTVVIELNEINVGWEYKRRCLGVYVSTVHTYVSTHILTTEHTHTYASAHGPVGGRGGRTYVHVCCCRAVVAWRYLYDEGCKCWCR